MPYKDPLEKKEYNKQYSQKNRKRIRDNHRKWRNSPEGKKRFKKIAQRYKQSPKGIFTSLKTNNKNRVEIKISREDFIKWYKRQEKKCYYCEIPIKILKKYKLFQKNKQAEIQRLQIDRKNNAKPYELGNIVLACPICNFLKSSFFTEKEFKEIAQKYIRPKWDYSQKENLKFPQADV